MSANQFLDVLGWKNFDTEKPELIRDTFVIVFSAPNQLFVSCVWFGDSGEVYSTGLFNASYDLTMFDTIPDGRILYWKYV